MLRTALAWCVHGYTAIGAVAALASLAAVVRGDLRAAFLWLAAQVFIDSTDGVLARAARVGERAGLVDGARLDDIVDYLTYVFVPATMVVLGGVVPAPLAWPIAGAMLLSSGFGFARRDAKTDDHYFTGFPSYWNIVLVYLVAFEVAAWGGAAILAGLVALVFVPIRYVYPSRTPIWRGSTVVLGGIWAAQMLAVIWTLPEVPRPLAWSSLVFPVYYVALSLALERRRAARRG